MRRLSSLLVTAVLLVAVQGAEAETPPTLKEVRDLVGRNLVASEALDVEAVRATIHSESPSIEGLDEMAAQLRAYRLRYEAKKVEYIGMTGEFALVRVVQHTTRISGPEFMDNELDAVWAIRKEDGDWKFWAQMFLDLKPLE